MQLLAATANAAQGGDSLAVLLPRLFPYFRHTLASVRRSCVQCLSALLKADPEGVPCLLDWTVITRRCVGKMCRAVFRTGQRTHSRA